MFTTLQYIQLTILFVSLSPSISLFIIFSLSSLFLSLSFLYVIYFVCQEWQETQKCQENVKRLKQTDELMQRTVFVGYTLCFRQLLMRAQRAVTHNHVPFVSRCVKYVTKHTQRRIVLLLLITSSSWL